MQPKTWTWINRTGWPSGPWDSEPDKIQWNDEQTGLTCIAVRNETLGHWCGYVGVPPMSPNESKHYDQIDVDVHGGLTFSGPCQDDPEHGICHVPEPGQPEHLFWFGFDCAHCNDLVPYMLILQRKMGHENRWDSYRDLNYVRQQTEHLARQLGAPK